MRKVQFTNGECYHIFNRGVDKRKTFLDDFDYQRFLTSMEEFNRIDPIGSIYEKSIRDRKNKLGHEMSKKESDEKLVEIICYCLNPNHYHLALKQVSDKGIEKFMQRLGNGYTKYFNNKNDRSGVLFQGVFKSIHIDSNEYLLYVSAYINKNNFIHGYSKDDYWRYSSFFDYIGMRDDKLCSKDMIMGQFKNRKEYKKFVDVNAEYLKEKKELEN